MIDLKEAIELIQKAHQEAWAETADALAQINLIRVEGEGSLDAIEASLRKACIILALSSAIFNSERENNHDHNQPG